MDFFEAVVKIEITKTFVLREAACGAAALAPAAL